MEIIYNKYTLLKPERIRKFTGAGIFTRIIRK